MAKIGPTEILIALLSMLILAVVAAMFTAWGWLIWRLLTGQPILPERPMVSRRETAWGVWTVLLLILVYLLVGFALANGYALATRRAAPRPTPPVLAKKAHVPDVPAPPALAKAAESTFAMTEMMFVNAVTQVVLLLTIPFLLRLTSGARLRDLGLSFDGWWRQAAVGLVAMLITTPVVWLVQLASISIWRPHGHPLETMLREQFSVEVGYLAILTAVILAPMLEEMTFRAILQRWLIKLLRTGETSAQPMETSGDLNGPDFGLAVESSIAGYWETEDGQVLVETVSNPQDASEVPRSTWKAIILTSLFFAVVHAAQWPAPIAIFVLSLVLGVVYHCTGSLIASIVTHAAFNGFSTVLMFMTLLVGPNADTKKVPPEATMHGWLLHGWEERGSSFRVGRTECCKK